MNKVKRVNFETEIERKLLEILLNNSEINKTTYNNAIKLFPDVKERKEEVA